MSGDESAHPEEASSRSRSWFTHPLLLALIPAVTAVVVAIITINANRGSAPPPTQVSNGPDVTVRIDRDDDLYSDGWEVAFDRDLPNGSDASLSEGSESLLQWALTRGAVDVGQSHLRMYVENNSDTRLTIRQIRAIVEKRQPTLTQTLVRSPSAGANELVQLLFALDAGDVVDAAVPSQDRLLEPAGQYFTTKDITLDAGETIDLKLTVTARTCLCQYRFVLDILKANTHQEIEVRDETGDDFVITGPSARYGAEWESGSLGCNKRGLFPVDSSGAIDCARKAPNA